MSFIDECLCQQHLSLYGKAQIFFQSPQQTSISISLTRARSCEQWKKNLEKENRIAMTLCHEPWAMSTVVLILSGFPLPQRESYLCYTINKIFYKIFFWKLHCVTIFFWKQHWITILNGQTLQLASCSHAPVNSIPSTLSPVPPTQRASRQRKGRWCSVGKLWYLQDMELSWRRHPWG